jgi:glycosidase
LEWAREACFYHLMIDRFATGRERFVAQGHVPTTWMGGTLAGITESLDYLSQLGITALMISPFLAGSKYHGYWVTEHRRIDPHFGGDQDLRGLIEQARRRGIRVVMDLPITHCYRESSLFQSPSGGWAQFVRDDKGQPVGFFGDPCLPELDLDHPEVRREIKAIVDHWLDFGFDGIRFDHAKRPSQAFWEDLCAHLRRRTKPILLLGENWTESGEIGSLSGHLDAELNFPVSLALRRFLRDPSVGGLHRVDAAVTRQECLRARGYIMPTFLDSHDVERAVVVARGDWERLKLTMLLQFALPYPPIIYYGSERGQGQSRNLEAGRFERDAYFREPLRWDLGHGFTTWVRELVALRRLVRPWLAREKVTFTWHSEGVASWTCGEGQSALEATIACDGARVDTLEVSCGNGRALCWRAERAPSSGALGQAP